MVNEKRKKISVTEAGGDHASALIGGAVSNSNETERVVYSNTRIISENIHCPVCNGNFPSMSAYNSHSCMK
jgi:hypothetical protein